MIVYDDTAVEVFFMARSKVCCAIEVLISRGGVGADVSDLIGYGYGHCGVFRVCSREMMVGHIGNIACACGIGAVVEISLMS